MQSLQNWLCTLSNHLVIKHCVQIFFLFHMQHVLATMTLLLCHYNHHLWNRISQLNQCSEPVALTMVVIWSDIIDWCWCSTFSLPRVIGNKFILQPHQKYYITQYEELWLLIAYSDEIWLHYQNSHYLMYTILFKRLGNVLSWTWGWKG